MYEEVCVIKEDAFPVGQRLMLGMANICDHSVGKVHLFLDIDKKPLSDIISDIYHVQEKFDLGTFLIVMSSPFSFQVLNFDRIWKIEYENIALEFKTLEKGYLFRSQQKDYSILRIGDKFGFSPKLLYSISNEKGVECRPCYLDYLELVSPVR